MQRCWRLRLLVFILLLIFVAICFRLFQLCVYQRNFLMKQSHARILRNVKVKANRGIIYDRHRQPLAISTPVMSYWFDPRIFKPTLSERKALEKTLHLSRGRVAARIRKAKGRSFFYLKRRTPPGTAATVKAMKIKGLYQLPESRRFYPQGAVTAHVLGFTNIDDQGQEGLEMAFNRWLAGKPGRKSVVKDRLGEVVETLSVGRAPSEGKDLTLSIDERIQYVAYKSLHKAMEKYHAKSGSVVVLDVQSGEVYAMANQPSFNPNNRAHITPNVLRNRAVTDLFEPGSTIKPFTVAMALMSGKYDKHTLINTHPGRMKVGGFTIHDDLDFGVVDLTKLLQKSSNIAAAKILLSLNPTQFWRLLQAVGFGSRTQTEFPGEADGLLTPHDHWYASEVAALAYGYGVSVNALQLAHAYSILAADGLSHPVTFLKHDSPQAPQRALPESVASDVRNMLVKVVETGKSGVHATGTRAAIPGYHVAGKTGTAYVATAKGYNKKRYVSSFVGFAPATKPRLVVAVVIHEPHGRHFGAVVAAPTFKTIMEQSLHLLGVPSDAA